MDLREYVRLQAEFKARIGGKPPSILTEQGAIEYMRRVLSELLPSGSNRNEHSVTRD